MPEPDLAALGVLAAASSPSWGFKPDPMFDDDVPDPTVEPVAKDEPDPTHEPVVEDVEAKPPLEDDVPPPFEPIANQRVRAHFTNRRAWRTFVVRLQARRKGATHVPRRTPMPRTRGAVSGRVRASSRRAPPGRPRPADDDPDPDVAERTAVAA